MNGIWFLAIILEFFCIILNSHCRGVPLSDYISHYEPVIYDHHDIQGQHHRVRRSIQSAVDLQFNAHGRDFRLHLEPDSTVYSEDLTIENSNGPTFFQPNIAYRGTSLDDSHSIVHGTISSNGVFTGKINIPNRDTGGERDTGDERTSYTNEQLSLGEQYSIEHSAQHFKEPRNFHSIIYKYSDVTFNLNDSLCLSNHLRSKLHENLNHTRSKFNKDNIYKKFQDNMLFGQSTLNKYSKQFNESPRSHTRKKREIVPEKTTCELYLQADHLFYQFHGNNEETVIEQLTQHVQGVIDIYRIVDFDGDGSADNIRFIIKKIKIHSDPTADGYKFNGNFGVESYLELFSEDNFDDFCLGFMFTYRDFEGGTLGLAWTGDTVNAGGVCEKYGIFKGNGKSLNTGLVTVLNYGKDVPSVVSVVTFAHEIGHNMGSPHDPDGTASCTPGGDSGNYIMYARATSGDKSNNNKFSSCSRTNMGDVMAVKARSATGCFIEPTGSICGNDVVEPGEECDCGWDDECTEICCNPQRLNANSLSPTETPCTLKPNATCSPSQGPCCNATCDIIPTAANFTCRDETSCKHGAVCLASCPLSPHKPNRTICDDESVCYIGECSGSICLAYGLESCQCNPSVADDWTDVKLCQLCCKEAGETSPCKSSHEWNDAPYIVPDLMSRPGSACYNYQGYCDVFSKCREVDPSGPLNTLKNFLFTSEGIESMKEWLTQYWWAVALAAVGLVVIMGLFIKFCSPRVPSDEDLDKKKTNGKDQGQGKGQGQSKSQGKGQGQRRAPGPSSQGRRGSRSNRVGSQGSAWV